jgi:hypothetical protein
MAQAVVLPACIREGPGLNLDRDTDYRDSEFRGSPQSLM